jgi:hypothetical protein
MLAPARVERVLLRLLLHAKVEGVEQIVQRRTIGGHIGVGRYGWIREIVASVRANCAQSPVPLDEFNDGNMVCVAVVDDASGGVRRNDQQRDTGAIAEVIYRLDVTGVVITAAFIEGDEDRRARPE